MEKRTYLIIALLSVTLIGLEIVWTRIFSAEFFYTFAFLILSLAILGLGLGALTLRLLPFLNRGRNLGVLLSLTALAALAGPPAVMHMGMKFSTLLNSWAMVGKLAATIVILSSSFFFGGIALAMLFRQNHFHMPRLYMADLLGAGGGVALAILLMNDFGTLMTVFLIALPILIAAFIASRRWLKVLPLLLTAAVVVLSVYADPLLTIKREERAPVIYTHWDAMSKLKIHDRGEGFRGINIDNVANSGVLQFDGNWDRPDSMRFEFGITVDYLIRQFDSCTFLSLGAGGGMDVMQALQEGATEIHAVEVNPHINYLMQEGDLAEYSGHIYDDPRVTVATEDARAYVRRFKNKFDVIYSLSSNTWAALASGAFALAESYLFTTEAYMDYWESLSDSGFMMMEHQFYMPRLVSEVMEALEREGVPDIKSHFAIYDLPKMRRNILLLSKRPLTDSLRYHAIHDLTPEVYEYIHLLYPAPDSTADNLINQLVLNGWESMADTIAFDISTCTDNRPFVAHMGMWKNFTWEPVERLLPYEFYGFPLTKIILLVILVAVGVLVLPLNLIPYFTRGEKLRAAPWLYFFTIGMAFMVVEVVMIQKYTLFVGPSVYSVATILLTLLVASGIGSRFARSIDRKIVFPAIIIWLLLDIFVFGSLTTALGGAEMFTRMLVTALLIAPLGFFMGIPFPKGALKVGELVDWGFAVNGAASVLGATAIVLVAITFGFTAALLIGAGLYLLAYALISFKPGW